MTRPIRQSVIAMILAMLVVASGAGAQEVRLPDMGSPADAVLNKNEEARIGRMIMQQIRASGQLVEDPLINEYINEVGHRVAAQTNDGDHSFTFFVVEDPNINAFALPGGYIGVHSGLLEATRSEDELAGVLAHEVAHVTQRHIARAIHASSRQSILSTALMLGAVILGASGGNGDAVQGAIAVAQGTAAQAQINFTRSNEYEADRIGIAALAGAGFNPHGMASFFEVMSRLQPSSPNMRMPEFLRTHPVTTARISEARMRAREYERRMPSDSTNYGIARARVKIEAIETDEEAILQVEQRAYENQTDEERYARAIAYQRVGRNLEAMRIFEELASKDQKVIAYHIGLGQTQLALEMQDRGIETFERAIRLFPRNVPLVIHYGEWLVRLGRAEQAHEMLLDMMNNVPPTPEQVRLLATAASSAGEMAEAYYYMSEYRLMTGDLVGGISFLREALSVPDIEEIQRIRFEARIDFIREFMTEEQLRQMQRSRPADTSARNAN